MALHSDGGTVHTGGVISTWRLRKGVRACVCMEAAEAGCESRLLGIVSIDE